MQQLGNILEALRFAGNHLKDHKLSTGMLALHHAIETVNILWHVGKVEDQKTLMAAAVHQVPRIQEELKIGVVEIFGEDVSSYIQMALSPESLKIPYLERLKLKKNKAEIAGRNIYIAATCAFLRHAKDQRDDLAQILKSEEINTRRENIDGFAGANEDMEQLLKQLIDLSAS